MSNTMNDAIKTRTTCSSQHTNCIEPTKKAEEGKQHQHIDTHETIEMLTCTNKMELVWKMEAG